LILGKLLEQYNYSFCTYCELVYCLLLLVVLRYRMNTSLMN